MNIVQLPHIHKNVLWPCSARDAIDRFEGRLFRSRPCTWGLLTYGWATWRCSKRFGFFQTARRLSRRLIPGRTPLRHNPPDCCHDKSNLRWPGNERSRLCLCKRTGVCNSYCPKLQTDRPNILSNNRNLTLTIVAPSFVLPEWCDAASLWSMTKCSTAGPLLRQFCTQ
jgi:hypothetical protein